MSAGRTGGFWLPVRSRNGDDWHCDLVDGEIKALYHICHYLSLCTVCPVCAARLIAKFLRDTRDSQYKHYSDPGFFQIARSAINRAIVHDFVGGPGTQAMFRHFYELIAAMGLVVENSETRIKGLHLPDDTWVAPPHWTE